jgi:hypothetical protein
MNRGQLPARLLPTRPGGDGPERMSGRTTIRPNTPSHIMSPTRSQPGTSAEVSQGVRGHTPIPQRAHAPPAPVDDPPNLDTPSGTSKQWRVGDGAPAIAPGDPVDPGYPRWSPRASSFAAADGQQLAVADGRADHEGTHMELP